MLRYEFLMILAILAAIHIAHAEEDEDEDDFISVFDNIDIDSSSRGVLVIRSDWHRVPLHRDSSQCRAEDTCAASLKDKTATREKDNNKYIFFYVTPTEGFNLRRDVYMRFAIMLAEAHKQRQYLEWKLVLPPWRRMYHWLTPEISQSWVPLPWSKFFDIDSLKSYAPVVELHEVFSKHPSNHFKIDVHFNIKAFEDPYEAGIFLEKLELKDCNCVYEGNYFGYVNISAKKILDLEFQGKISLLWEALRLNPNATSVVFAHGEIPLHDNYGSKAFWDCRRSMKFNKWLYKIADKYIKERLGCNSTKCENYVSVHWRRKDFVLLRKDTPSIKSSITQIHQFMIRRNIQTKNIFVATDAEEGNFTKLERGLKKKGYTVFSYKPKFMEIQAIKDGGVAIVDQIICSRASYFIGSFESAFTYRIYEERELLGWDPMTTFNRLCPDTGKCEKPAQWRAVH